MHITNPVDSSDLISIIMSEIRRNNFVQRRYRSMFQPLRLTSMRRLIIELYIQQHPRGQREAAAILRYLVRFDPRIQLSDVNRWIQRHSWITDVRQEHRASALSEPAMNPRRTRWMAARNSMSPHRLQNHVLPTPTTSSARPNLSSVILANDRENQLNVERRLSSRHARISQGIRSLREGLIASSPNWLHQPQIEGGEMNLPAAGSASPASTLPIFSRYEEEVMLQGEPQNGNQIQPDPEYVVGDSEPEGPPNPPPSNNFWISCGVSIPESERH